MVFNSKEKVFSKRDFLASESLGLGWLSKLSIFLLMVGIVILLSSLYFYVVDNVEISLFEFIIKRFGFDLNWKALLKRYGVFVFIFLLGVVGVHLFKRHVANWHTKTPILAQPLLLNWNNEIIIIRSLNEEFKSTLYWKDVKNAKKTAVGVNLFLNPVYPIRIPFDWFDNEDNKQNFLQLVKNATGKTIN